MGKFEDKNKDSAKTYETRHHFFVWSNGVCYPSLIFKVHIRDAAIGKLSFRAVKMARICCFKFSFKMRHRLSLGWVNFVYK